MSDTGTNLTATAEADNVQVSADADLDLPAGVGLHDKEWRRIYQDGLLFEQELKNLRDADKGRMAALRRNCRESLRTTRGTFWFYERLRSALRKQHAEQYFRVATLFDTNRAIGIVEDLGGTMRRLSEVASGSFEQRFLALIDSNFESTYDAVAGKVTASGGDMTYRLAPLIKMAGSKNIGVCWPILLADICCWGRLQGDVRRKWASNYYNARTATETDEPVGAAVIEGENKGEENDAD